MPEKQLAAPWRDRFHLKYAGVLRELPALLRLQSLKPRSVPSPQTVLIVNCCLIGDFVVSLPAIVDFIREHPTAQVDLLISPSVVPLARRLRGVRRVYTARSVFGRTTERSVSDEKLAPSYDLVVVSRLSEQARVLLATTSYRAIRTYLIPFLKYAVHLAIRPSAQVKQMSEYTFEAFGKFGRHEQSLCADDVFDFTGVPAVDARPGRTVVVHTGSESRVHLWPIDKWVALLERIQKLNDVSFVFVGGTEEEERTFDEISRRVSFPIHSVIRQYDVLEVVMLMRMSTLFVGVDSGPRHLAHLVGLPSVSLLGPGPKSFEPLNRDATIIDETDCKRCVTFYCPYTPSCVGRIDLHTVEHACQTTLMTTDGCS
jgi:ADP-heptose:LPS heptosyltransferase